MKRFAMMTVLAMLFLSSAAAYAECGGCGPDDKGPRGGMKGKEGESRWRRGMGKGDGCKNLMAVFKSLELTEEQNQQVREIMKSQRQAVQNWRKENEGKMRQLRQKLREAKKDGNDEAAADIKAEMEKLATSRKELHENLMKRLGDVLNEKQMDKVRQWFKQAQGKCKDKMRASNKPRIKQMMDKLDLTDEQKSKMKDIHAETRKKLEAAETRQAKGEILRESMKKMEEVLTPEQLEKLKKMAHRKGPGRGKGMGMMGLDLTKEQQDKAREIHQKYRKQLAEAKTQEARKEIREKMRKELSGILTDEQKEKMTERFQKQGRGGRGKGRLPLKELNLTEDQQAKIKEIHQQGRKKLSQTSDPDQWEEIIRETRRKVHDVLTDEQREQLREKMQKRFRDGGRGQRRPGRRQNWPGGQCDEPCAPLDD